MASDSVVLLCQRTFIRIAGERTSQNNAQGGEDGQHQNRLNNPRMISVWPIGMKANMPIGRRCRVKAPVLKEEPAHGTQHNGKCRPAEPKSNKKPDADVETADR